MKRQFLDLFSLVITGYLAFTLQAAVVNPPSGGGSGGSSTNASGTAGHLAEFTGTNNLRNSIATFQGSTNITIPGTLSVNGALIRATGNDTNDLSLGIGAGAANGATNTGNYGIGSGSLGSLTTGHSNVGLGKNTGAALTSGYDNTYLGTSSGGGTDARENTGVGKRALSQSGNSISNNVAVGVSSGAAVTGHANTFLGFQAAGVTSGSSNTVIGHDISTPSATANNQLAIMNGIFGTGLEGTGTTVSTGKIGILTNAPGYTLDVAGIAGATSLITGTNGLSLSLLNTDASNYERGRISIDSAGVHINMEAAGTGTLRPVDFRTGGGVAMTIATNKSVSISGGTSITPLSVIHSNATTGGTLTLRNNAASGYTEMRFLNDGGSYAFALGHGNSGAGLPRSLIYANEDIQISPNEFTTTSLYLKASNGNVGVRTLTPAAALHVVGVIVGTGGIASSNVTASVYLNSATGWTNTMGVNAQVSIDGTLFTAVWYDNAGTARYTNATTLGHDTRILQNSGKVIITGGTGMTLAADPF